MRIPHSYARINCVQSLFPIGGFGMKNDYDRQCHSCGGFCKKSGCERENTHPAPPVSAEPVAWSALTDEDRKRAFDSMPDMLEGFLKTWGWLHFAKAIEEICKEKNAAPTGKQSLQVDRIDTSQEYVEKSNGNRQEPVGYQWLGSSHFRVKLPKDAEKYSWRPVFAHPAPDHTALLRQALEALESGDGWRQSDAIAAIRGSIE
jgi:hypothetical protein